MSRFYAGEFSFSIIMRRRKPLHLRLHLHFGMYFCLALLPVVFLENNHRLFPTLGLVKRPRHGNPLE